MVRDDNALSPTSFSRMQRRNNNTSMRLVIVVPILSLVLGTCCVAKLSDKRLCYDKDCSVVISTGRTTLPYHANDPDVLSFPGNVEIKVLSKSAGSRQDLWGAEVNGRRGYVPKKFVRELKVFQTDLKYTVPVKTAADEPVKKDTPESEVQAESIGDNIASPAQVDESKAQVPKDEVKESGLEDTISPQKIKPVFEYIYDGTVLPQEIDEVQPVTPSYSPPTTEDSAKAEDVVHLDLQPNILSSTFTAFSNLFSGDDESEGESKEDAEDVELTSSEKAQAEETAETIPGFVEKPEESSPVPEDNQGEVSKNGKPENNVETVVQETVSKAKIEKVVPKAKIEETVQEAKADAIFPDVKADETVPEAKPEETVQKAKADETAPEAKTEKTVQEAKVDETVPEVKADNIVAEAKIDEAVVESQSNSIVYPELKELYGEKAADVEQVANEETKLSKENVLQKEKETIVEEAVNEEKVISEEPIEAVQVKEDSVNQVPSPEIAAVVKENADFSVQTDSIKSKSTVEEIPVSVDTNTKKPFQIVVGEGVDGIEKGVNSVPNEEIVNVKKNILDAEKEIVESLPVPEAIPSGQEYVVDNNAFSTENNTSKLVSSQDIVLNKKTDDVNDTLVNSVTVEESSILEVPSKQETKGESATPPRESFVPQEPFYQPNISSNDGLSSKQLLEISENSTAPHTFVEESKPVESQWTTENQQKNDETVTESNNNVVVNTGYTTSKPTHLQNDSIAEIMDSSFPPIDSNRENIVDIPSTPSFGEFLGNRNLLNAGKGFQYDDSEEIVVDKIVIDESVHSTVPLASEETLVQQEDENISTEEIPVERNVQKVVLPMDTCDINSDCTDDTLHQYTAEANAVTSARKMTEFNSDILLIVCITAVTTLLFSLGYYFLENRRRDAFLIAKINKLEATLMKTEKECNEMQEKFTFTKTKLDSIEDESFGSNEMVTSLKAELVSSENMREELESQIASLEKELESTSEAGLELERMLREILSSQSEENNPLAQSIEELQTRLNDQQVANESLKTALTAKTQENENLTGDLTVSINKIEQLQTEVTKLAAELKSEISTKNNLEEKLSSKVQLLELQVKSMYEDKSTLRKQLKVKELEVKELLDVVEKFNSSNLDYEKLYEVSKIKAEAAHLLEERDELRTKISDEEGARQLLEEHVRLVTEEVTFLSEQCKAAEKEKLDAKTQLEVLKHFFEERETQRQKEEKKWLEKQGEHSSTVERLQAMQNEILNYKQQIEILKREILDQEKEYKNQIAALETKAHEHWVTARQNERRLEEVKAESSQLRNRLTLVEKNINEVDPETKLHRLQAAVATSNGEPERTPLYPGGETSNSPLMFVPGGPPPPLPPYHHLFPPPPFLPPPPPPENSRPPPLGGGRLSSPPPHHPSSASNPATSPPLSPPPHMFHHLPPPHELLPPPPLPLSSSHNSWGHDELPPTNANAFRPHGFQRPRNHKGSLHSSGDSLDKSHHSSKV